METKAEKPQEDDAAIVRQLAELPRLDYERARKDKAKAMNVRASVLDKMVEAERKEIEKSKEVSDVIEKLEPWDRIVDGAELLNETETLLQRHVILPAGAHIAIPLWAMGSYCMDVWQLFPKMLITSPTKRCGKTILLETLESMVFRALVTSNISPSAIFRCIEEWSPTLMLDEADTFTKDNDELNGVMNAGHRRRNAYVVRSEKDESGKFMPRKFSVWSPQVIAGIGEQRGTMHDRSIHIEIRRKMFGETVTKLPVDMFERQMNLRRRFMRWAEDNRSNLQYVEPPHCGNDRAQDNWVPLFTLANAVGGGWVEKVNNAYMVFNATANDDSGDIGILLLQDIKSIWDNRVGERIFSEDLVDALIAIEDRPWFEWKRVKPMTQNSLARMLDPYHIKSCDVKISGLTKRGYTRDSFKETFIRYLLPEGVQSATSLPSEEKGSTVALQTPPERGTNNVFDDEPQERI